MTPLEGVLAVIVWVVVLVVVLLVLAVVLTHMWQTEKREGRGDADHRA